MYVVMTRGRSTRLLLPGTVLTVSGMAGETLSSTSVRMTQSL
jgi:hypothetical protein